MVSVAGFVGTGAVGLFRVKFGARRVNKSRAHCLRQWARDASTRRALNRTIVVVVVVGETNVLRFGWEIQKQIPIGSNYLLELCE